MAARPRQSVALIDLAVDSDGPRSRVETALRRLDGLSLLEWCIRRLAETTLVDAIVVSGPAEFRTCLGQSCLYHAKWVESRKPSPAQRASEIAESMHADWVLHIHPACPFLDPALIDRLVARGLSQSQCDFVGFTAPGSPNFSLQRLGLVAEMSSSAGLDRLMSEGWADDPLDVPQLVRLYGNHLRTHWIPLPTQLLSDSLHFSMETEEDWEQADSLMEFLGEDLSWQRLASMADRGKA